MVPIKGHYGARKGNAKRVTIYQTHYYHMSSRQPNRPGGGKVTGWTKVGTVLTDRLGKYRMTIHAKSTTWYVVRYPGDAWYWGAWTDLVQVTAK